MRQEEAESRLRAALEACKEAERLAEKTRDIRSDWDEIFKCYDMAVSDIDLAQQIDPGVSIDDRGTRITPDDLLCRLLLFEGKLCIFPDFPDETIQNGIQAFERYLSYRRDDIEAMILLARAHTRIYERENALSVLRSALKVDPVNVKVRRLIDKIESNPEIGVAP